MGIRRHWKSCSKVEKLLDCEICQWKFGTKVALSLHCKREHPKNSDFKTGSKPTGNIPHSEPTLATQCPNIKSSDDQESQSVQKPVRYMHVLPKPKKGKWIVVLEKLDASPKIKKAKKSKAPVKAVPEITGGDEAENETGEKEVYELPYGWTKEVVYRRNQPSMHGKIRQDIYVISPGSKGNKFQSDVKLQRFL